MKNPLIIISCALVLPLCIYAQGTFVFWNPTAPTRLDAIDGPLAGPDIWAQSLVGLTADSLTPLGSPVQHHNGSISGDLVIVPFANYDTTVFVQMVAWNGTFWGTNMANVPANQFGRTDTVSLIVLPPTQSPLIPQFTQPAIIPIIPELSALSLIVFGGIILCLRHGWRRRRSRRDDAEAVSS